MTPKRTFILHTPSMHSASQQFIYLKLLSILAINLKSVIKLQQIQNKIRLKKPEKQTKINKKIKTNLIFYVYNLIRGSPGSQAGSQPGYQPTKPLSGRTDIRNNCKIDKKRKVFIYPLIQTGCLAHCRSLENSFPTTIFTRNLLAFTLYSIAYPDHDSQTIRFVGGGSCLGFVFSFGFFRQL